VTVALDKAAARFTYALIAMQEAEKFIGNRIFSIRDMISFTSLKVSFQELSCIAAFDDFCLFRPYRRSKDRRSKGES
jgi:hypothetical protein